MSSLKVIVNKEKTFELFRSANGLTVAKEKSLQKTPNMILKFFSQIGDKIEICLKSFFLPKTKKSFQKLGKPFGVIISDTMLKFHDADKRKQIRDIIFS